MDKVAEQPAVQVIDPDFHRRSQVQQILRQFGLSLQDLQELESFRKVPDMLSLAFAPDTRDEQLERIFASCLKKGHGLLFCAAPSSLRELSSSSPVARRVTYSGRCRLRKPPRVWRLRKDMELNASRSPFVRLGQRRRSRY